MTDIKILQNHIKGTIKIGRTGEDLNDDINEWTCQEFEHILSQRIRKVKHSSNIFAEKEMSFWGHIH